MEEGVENLLHSPFLCTMNIFNGGAMKGKRLGQLIFFAVLALLLLAELFFSNAGSLGNLETVAAQLGLSPQAERTRLFTLMALDAVGALGALLTVFALLGNRSLAKIGVPLTSLGFIAYGLYQLFSALTQLAPQWRMPISVVGVVYIVIGVVAWLVGRGLISQDGTQR
jgi:hypothetical protein